MLAIAIGRAAVFCLLHSVIYLLPFLQPWDSFADYATTTTCVVFVGWLLALLLTSLRHATFLLGGRVQHLLLAEQARFNRLRLKGKLRFLRQTCFIFGCQPRSTACVHPQQPVDAMRVPTLTTRGACISAHVSFSFDVHHLHVGKRKSGAMSASDAAPGATATAAAATAAAVPAPAPSPAPLPGQRE